MTPHASAAAWQLSTERRARGRSLRMLMSVVLALALWQWLAGYVFLLLIRGQPREATPLTIARYAYYFGEEPEVRKRLVVSSAGVLALIAGTGLVLILPRRRSLHGDARFASRREIARAGLLGEEGIILGRLGRRCLLLR